MALSYQQDRTINGPLTAESDLSTRDPFGGFIIKPMHFLFDFDNFPITDELINNVRRNQGRITPFDANNGGIYNIRRSTTPEQRVRPVRPVRRSSPTRWTGENWTFGESGGPANGNGFPTRLNLYKEYRYIGKANLDWQADRYNRLKLGGEFTRYYIDNYSVPPARQVLLGRVHAKSRSGGTASSKTASTWVTWSWSAACATTTTTAVPRARS